MASSISKFLILYTQCTLSCKSVPPLSSLIKSYWTHDWLADWFCFYIVIFNVNGDKKKCKLKVNALFETSSLISFLKLNRQRENCCLVYRSAFLTTEQKYSYCKAVKVLLTFFFCLCHSSLSLPQWTPSTTLFSILVTISKSQKHRFACFVSA